MSQLKTEESFAVFGVRFSYGLLLEHWVCYVRIHHEFAALFYVIKLPLVGALLVCALSCLNPGCAAFVLSTPRN